MALKPWVATGLAALAYLAYAVIITWPMPIHLGTDFYGGGGDDNWALITWLREMAEHGVNPFAEGRLTDIAAPEGQRVDYAINLVQWPSVLALYLPALAFGALPALNLFVLAGFVLNGTAMFLLVRKLTGHAGVAFVCGLGFAFLPRNVIGSQNHQYFVHGWVLVLLAWRLLELSDRPSLRNGVLAGLAAVFALSWNPYYILFGAVVYGVFVVWDAGRLALRKVAAWRPLVVGHVVSAAILIGVFVGYLLIASGTETVASSTSRPITEAYVYSSRIPEFVLPDPRHPVFGGMTGGYLFNHAHGSGYGEFNLYLGWSLMILAAVALLAAVRRRLREPRVFLFAGIALAGVLFSFPPTAQLGSVRLYFPAWFVFEVTSAWRAFSRILPVIGVGLVVLAGYGLAHLLRGRSLRTQAIVVPLVAAIVLFDLFLVPFQRTGSLPEPPIYAELRAQPKGGLVAEYPLLPDRIPLYEAKLNQDLHDRRVINGYVGGSEQEARALDLSRLDDNRTAPRLALLGVRWVITYDGPPQRPDVVPAGEPGSGFRLISKLGNHSLYEVVAPPARSWVAPGRGFSTREGGRGDEYHWITTPEATMELRATCERCDGTLDFRAQSFHVPRTLTVRGADGEVLARRRIAATGLTEMRMPVRFRRVEDLRLEMSPAPMNVRRTTGAPDDRDLGVLIHEPRLTLR